jgi:transcription elongation factor
MLTVSAAHPARSSQPILERVAMETLSYSAVKVILCRTCTGWVAPAAAAAPAAATTTTTAGESTGGWNDNELLLAVDDEW